MAPSVKFHPDDVDPMFDRKKEFYWDSLNYMEVMYFTYAMPGLPKRKKDYQSIEDISDKVCQQISLQIIGLYKLKIVCAREEIHANLRKTSEDVGLSNQCTTTTCIQKCANFSSMEAAEAMPTSKNFSSKCQKTQC